MEDTRDELASLPADPWDGIEAGFLRQPRWWSRRTWWVIVVTLCLASYAGGVVFLVLSGEW
jgi:hypothetical protein